MIDLSHPIEPEMPTFPGDPVVETWPHATLDATGFNLTAIGLSTHTGTHIDAPSHVEPDGRSLSEFPLERFRYDAVVVDCDVDAGEPIDPGIVPEVPSAELLLFRTGWDRYWGDERYWKYPYLSAECARVCARRELDVGLDAPSVDPKGAGLRAHHELFRADRLIVENLTNLAALPERTTVYAFPLPIVPGDGSPVRVVAEA